MHLARYCRRNAELPGRTEARAGTAARPELTRPRPSPAVRAHVGCQGEAQGLRRWRVPSRLGVRHLDSGEGAGAAQQDRHHLLRRLLARCAVLRLGPTTSGLCCCPILLPCMRTTQSSPSRLSRAGCVGYTSGNGCELYGSSGKRFSWQDQPSFDFLVRHLSDASRLEELHTFQKCVAASSPRPRRASPVTRECTGNLSRRPVCRDRHVCPTSLRACQTPPLSYLLAPARGSLVAKQHPGYISTADPITGESLLQAVVNKSPALLDALLQSTVRMGLQPAMDGRTALHVAIAKGDTQSVNMLLRTFAGSVRRSVSILQSLGFIHSNPSRESSCVSPLVNRRPRRTSLVPRCR